jgi:cytochrome c553
MRNMMTRAGRCTWVTRGSGLWLGVAVVLTGVGTATRADAPDAEARSYAQKVAIGTCGTCHGPTGNSSQPKFPRLAGQSANYLATQLKAFRAESRGDPDAIGYMWGMASQLDDVTIAALADYYAQQKPDTSGRGSDSALV